MQVSRCATTPTLLVHPVSIMETMSSANDAIKYVHFLYNDLEFPLRLGTEDNIIDKLSCS